MNTALLVIAAILMAALAAYYFAAAYFARREILRRMPNRDGTVRFGGAFWFRRFLQWVDESSWGNTTARMLARADLPIRPSLFGGLQMFATILLYAIFVYGGLDLGWSFTLSTTTIWAGRSLLLYTRSGRIAASVEEQLPRVTRLLANALRAGLSIRQGFEAVAHDVRPPAGSVFRRLHEELQLNVPVEKALDRLVDRVPSTEVQLLADVVLIQHKVGGDLVGALEEMTTTLIERHALNQEARTATAQQRFVAWMLPFMLLATMAMLGLLLPGFLKPLFSEAGILFVVLPVGFVVVGSVFLVIRFSAVRW